MTEHPDYIFPTTEDARTHVQGKMDIDVQEKTYIGFLKAAKYLTIFSIACVVLTGFLTL